MKLRAQAYSKVNLFLGVGPRRDDGFHELSTIFQSLSLNDEVTLRTEGSQPHTGAWVKGLKVRGLAHNEVPEDQSNLAWKAVTAVVNAYSSEGYVPHQTVHLDIRKGIPVAGGMAGGSADAAAALLLADRWLSTVHQVPGLGEERLLAIAAELGSDVPFSLLGGTQRGEGRGEKLSAVANSTRWWWVIALSRIGLSTPKVFHTLDHLRDTQQIAPPQLDCSGIIAALASGDPLKLAAELHNDLAAPALALQPALRRTLEAGTEAGALSGIISGSGPTCAFLCHDRTHADAVAARLRDSQVADTIVTAYGPAGGAEILE
ncbi:4-(cytidine 5'-diphospho)-2-C-methyl-D-erythritol kinase [Corynebacterium poyangense]|uniref:4-diphosphocytidyl-2-C-methyl-D-erythritol kinase n=1 Tax=Corynebacterium poyangense TaxID=2684405 RepID=A0A7H0SMY0_9CORY|nr:4-(cytidine 5'-diphospho)-2-C-methyl-D-erythritol kinase [Corynebacterium poyangense]MBZ8176263.1 4-(cytidine 5'-diphospho)-2-C-methyl-D-erythritol kinase [Corynebacterium poyangense]QNQ89905.1 4-(cytidine 5'-diphospho)-2-C-methyl-D-erythritol kinase [Corynebacterium poyangense]